MPNSYSEPVKNRLFRAATTLSMYERVVERTTGVRPKLKLLRGWIYINNRRYSTNQVVQLIKEIEARASDGVGD